MATDSYYPDIKNIQTMDNVMATQVLVLFALLFVVGILSNALVVVVVLCHQRMLSTTNILIINIAMANIIFIVFCVPFTASDYSLRYWPFGDIWCRVVHYLFVVCPSVSIYTLVLMLIGRLLAVVYRKVYKPIRSKTNTYFAISGIWAVILISCIPVLVFDGEIKFTFHSVCICLVWQGPYSFSSLQVSLFLSSFVITFALIFVLYLLWFAVSPVCRFSAPRVDSKNRFAVLVVILKLCCCPLQIILVLLCLKAYEINTFKLSLQIGGHILAYFNSCVIPLLYVFLSNHYWKLLHEVRSGSNPQRNQASNSRRKHFQHYGKLTLFQT